MKKRLEKTEERLALKDRPPAICISFLFYDDGTVPDVTDRELADWELIKGHDGSCSVSLCPIHEYELRRGWTKAAGPNISPDLPTYEPGSMPEAPAEDRIPKPIFDDWLCGAIERFRENWGKLQES
ncbi:MAG: hypothetical protein CEE38_08435 [Planctomycetes bacterium B3_Pla]|nr:MAG: hypothetical protein CEE38_08435 [Planctomycetes bacterium B3_Pla]